jgi:hypothetical protein
MSERLTLEEIRRVIFAEFDQPGSKVRRFRRRAA